MNFELKGGIFTESGELDFSGRTQLYFQLYDILYKDIRSGVYPAGEMLPTEKMLGERYGISRITVRKALELLEKDGLIAKKRGYGTVVLQKKFGQSLTKVEHFTNEMAAGGRKATVKVLANEVTYAGKAIAEELGISEGDSLVRVERLRCADGKPLCIENSHLILARCPDVPDTDFSDRSLRLFLEEKYGIRWKHARQKIYAVTANARLAGYLDIKTGDPLLYIERISYDEQDRPGEYLQVWYRGDSYYLAAELQA